MQWSWKLGLGALLAVQTASAGIAVSPSEVKLIASDAAEGDRLGNSVALDGNTLVVGARRADDAAGAAYVFRRDLNTVPGWIEVKKLTAADATEGDRFGHAVAVSGDTVAVGAYANPNVRADPGSAYVFQRNWGGDDNWGQVKKLNASDAAEGDSFGHSISIDGDTVAVGAYTDADAGVDSGSAYIFQRNWGGDDNWGQVKELNASDAAAGDTFGQSIAIGGDTIAVGADNESELGDSSGSVYLFERNQGGANNWGQAKKLNASDETNWDHFGWSLSIDGDRLVVGMWGDDDPLHRCGSAYVFDRDFGGNDNWGQVKKLQASDPDGLEYFGRSVSVSNDRLIASSITNSVYLFERQLGGENHWGEVIELRASDAANDSLGTAIAINGDTIAAGGILEGTTTGAAFVYSLRLRLLPTVASWGLACLAALLLFSGVGARRRLARRRSPTGPRDAGEVGRLARPRAISRPR